LSFDASNLCVRYIVVEYPVDPTLASVESRGLLGCDAAYISEDQKTSLRNITTVKASKLACLQLVLELAATRATDEVGIGEGLSALVE
jgi:hypothetical protein